jgi:uncharacterized protein (TIGR03067 family)
MTRMFLTPLLLAALFAAGCSTPRQSKPAAVPATAAPAAVSATPTPPKIKTTPLEGLWKGQDVTPGQEASVTLAFTGHNLEFHAADPGTWLKGTFTLREDTNPKQLVGTITESAASELIGLKVYSIYKLESGTLTLAGYPPGIPTFPPSFDAPGCNHLIFKDD